VAEPPGNILYYGDNLDVLRQHVPGESIDLVYLDPPFNSNASYRRGRSQWPRRGRLNWPHPASVVCVVDLA